MNQEYKKLPKETRKKFEEAAMSDVELWESGDFGKTPEFMQEAEKQENKKFHDLKKKSENIPTSIRMPKELIEGLQKLAHEDGLPYQTYVKLILRQHLKNRTRKSA